MPNDLALYLASHAHAPRRLWHGRAPGTGTITATKDDDTIGYASETVDKMRWFSAPRILSVSATSVVM